MRPGRLEVPTQRFAAQPTALGTSSTLSAQRCTPPTGPAIRSAANRPGHIEHPQCPTMHAAYRPGDSQRSQPPWAHRAPSVPNDARRLPARRFAAQPTALAHPAPSEHRPDENPAANPLLRTRSPTGQPTQRLGGGDRSSTARRVQSPHSARTPYGPRIASLIREVRRSREGGPIPPTTTRASPSGPAIRSAANRPGRTQHPLRTAPMRTQLPIRSSAPAHKPINPPSV